MGLDQITSGKPANAPVGSGMARQGMRTLQNLPYQRHVQEARAMGQEPMSPEQFMMQQGG